MNKSTTSSLSPFQRKPGAPKIVLKIFQKIQIQFSFGISRFIFFSFSALEGSGLLATLASGGQMDWQPATYICFSSSMVRLTKDLRSARTGNFKVGRYELLAS